MGQLTRIPTSSGVKLTHLRGVGVGLGVQQAPHTLVKHRSVLYVPEIEVEWTFHYVAEQIFGYTNASQSLSILQDQFVKAVESGEFVDTLVTTNPALTGVTVAVPVFTASITSASHSAFPTSYPTSQPTVTPPFYEKYSLHLIVGGTLFCFISIIILSYLFAIGYKKFYLEKEESRRNIELIENASIVPDLFIETAKRDRNAKLKVIRNVSRLVSQEYSNINPIPMANTNPNTNPNSKPNTNPNTNPSPNTNKSNSYPSPHKTKNTHTHNKHNNTHNIQRIRSKNSLGQTNRTSIPTNTGTNTGINSGTGSGNIV